MPQKYNPYKIIVDEEFLLNQTPSKQLLTSHSQNEEGEKQILSDKVQLWFNAEYFYSQMDRLYFASNDFSTMLESLGIRSAQLTVQEWSLLRQTLLMINTPES